MAKENDKIAEEFEHYLKAVEQDDTNAMLELAAEYHSGNEALGIPVDHVKAFELELQAAQAGNAEAQAYVGFDYIEGDGVEENRDRGYGWLRLGISNIGGDIEKIRSLCLQDIIGDGELRDYLDYVFFEGWPLRGGIEGSSLSPDTHSEIVKDETPFWKCGNVAFWGRYINEHGYMDSLGSLKGSVDKTGAYADLLRFQFNRWFTIAEIDEFRRVFYWMNSSEKPLSEMLDGLNVWQMISNMCRDITYAYAIWGRENFQTGQFAAFVDQWMRNNKPELSESYPLFSNCAWEELGATLSDEFNRLRVLMNALLRSSLTKLFGCYEKHVAAIVPLLENKFAIYEDYKAYVVSVH